MKKKLAFFFDQLETVHGMAIAWSISRKNFAYEKTTIKLGEDNVVENGTCKIWEKPKDNAF